MPLAVNVEPDKGGPGTQVTLEAEEFDVEQFSEEVKAYVQGQPFTQKLKPAEEEGKFKTQLTVPMGAPYGTYKIKFKSSNGEESTKKFKVK